MPLPLKRDPTDELWNRYRLFSLTDEQAAKLSYHFNLKPRARREVEELVGYYRWVSTDGDDGRLKRRLKRLYKQAVTCSSPSEQINVIRAAGRVLNDASVFEALQKGTVGVEPWRMPVVEVGRIRLQEAIVAFPNEPKKLHHWLYRAWQRLRSERGSRKSGYAEVLIQGLALIWDRHHPEKLTRSGNRYECREFIELGCSVATDATDFEIGKSTVDAFMEEYIWERNFLFDRGLTVLGAMRVCKELGLVGQHEDALPPSEDPRRAWLEWREAVHFWREKMEPTFKPYFAHKQPSDMKKAFAKLLLSSGHHGNQH